MTLSLPTIWVRLTRSATPVPENKLSLTASHSLISIASFSRRRLSWTGKLPKTSRLLRCAVCRVISLKWAKARTRESLPTNRSILVVNCYLALHQIPSTALLLTQGLSWIHCEWGLVSMELLKLSRPQTLETKLLRIRLRTHIVCSWKALHIKNWQSNHSKTISSRLRAYNLLNLRKMRQKMVGIQTTLAPTLIAKKCFKNTTFATKVLWTSSRLSLLYRPSNHLPRALLP